MVATATLVVVAGPTVAATMAPPVGMGAGSSLIPGLLCFIHLGPTTIILAQVLLLLLLIMGGLLGPDILGPSLLPPFLLHLGLLIFQTMDILMVYLGHVRHKAITPGLILLQILFLRTSIMQ